jgi:hypothetical protein
MHRKVYRRIRLSACLALELSAETMFRSAQKAISQTTLIVVGIDVIKDEVTCWQG